MTKISQRSGAAATAMLGLGVYRPERVVTNAEVCEVLDSNDEWIQTRSGIRTRRYADADETLLHRLRTCPAGQTGGTQQILRRPWQ